MENPQPKKSPWSVGRNETSIVGKKESWNGLETCQEKKKREVSSERDTSKESLVHYFGYVTMMDVKY